MKFEKLVQVLEKMPAPAYIFLKSILAFSAAMLALSLFLFLFGSTPEAGEMAVVFLELPASVLVLGVVGLALLMDSFEE